MKRLWNEMRRLWLAHRESFKVFHIHEFFYRHRWPDACNYLAYQGPRNPLDSRKFKLWQPESILGHKCSQRSLTGMWCSYRSGKQRPLWFHQKGNFWRDQNWLAMRLICIAQCRAGFLFASLEQGVVLNEHLGNLYMGDIDSNQGSCSTSIS